jgi:hypothetical protein
MLKRPQAVHDVVRRWTTTNARAAALLLKRSWKIAWHLKAKGQVEKVVIDADIHSGSAHQSSEVGTQFSCVLGIAKQSDPPKLFSF